jgi:hypothetical protein
MIPMTDCRTLVPLRLAQFHWQLATRASHAPALRLDPWLPCSLRPRCILDARIAGVSGCARGGFPVLTAGVLDYGRHWCLGGIGAGSCLLGPKNELTPIIPQLSLYRR